MSDSYDEIPYQSIPFTDTHPENLAALGRLFGLNTPVTGCGRHVRPGSS